MPGKTAPKRYMISFFDREGDEPYHSIETDHPPVVPRKNELVNVNGVTRQVWLVEYGYDLHGFACHVLVRFR